MEDDPASALLNKSFLQRMQLGTESIEVAQTGKDAYKLTQSNDWDLILLDLGLPDMSGVELLKKLSNTPKKSSYPILVVSGDTDSKLLNECFRLGASDFISKGSSLDEFQIRIKNTIHKFAYQNARSSNLRTLNENSEVVAKTQEFWHDIANCISAMELTRELKKLANQLPEDCTEKISQSSPNFLHIIEALDANTSVFQSIFNDTIQKRKNRDPFRFELVSAKQLVKEVTSVFENSLKQHSIELNTELEDVESIYTIKDKLYRILYNLVANSVQALEEQSDAMLSICIKRQHENLVKVRISDNGPGIPPLILQNLGKRYNSNKSNKNLCVHSGLGLALVFDLVNNLKGKIDYSTSENGTTFEIILEDIH